MGIWAIVISVLLYFTIAFSNLRDKDYPHAMIWTCYAFANVGFLWHELIKKQLL